MNFFTYARLMIAIALLSLAAQLQAAQVYLDAQAPYSDSNPQWKVWTWADGQTGSWVTGTTLSNGLVEFTVNQANLQFVRFSTDGNTEWNRTVDLSTVDDATYTITGWGSGSGMTVNVTPCVRVNLDASAIPSGLWYAWSFPTTGSGYWAAPFSQSGNTYVFRVASSNQKILFANRSAAPANVNQWGDGVNSQTGDLYVRVGDTYVLTSATGGYWLSDQKSLNQLASDEYYLPDSWALTNVPLTGTYVALYYIENEDILILRDYEEADFKWNHDENDSFYQNLLQNGYDFHVYKYSDQYKQNNWVALHLTSYTNQLESIKNSVGHIINGGFIGSMNVSKSFDIDLTLDASQTSLLLANYIGAAVEPEDTVLNVYGAPHFNIHDQGRIYNDNMRNPVSDNSYGSGDFRREGPQFLVLPKPNEVCYLQWGILIEDTNNPGNYYFETPEKYIAMKDGEFDLASSRNIYNMHGQVKLNFDYNEGGMAGFVQGNIHDKVKGLVKTVASTVKSPQWAPRRINADPDQYFGIETKDWDIEYVFYPLEAAKATYNPQTDLNSVIVDRKVTGVTYYNLAGHSASKPFDGINIVRTTYSDGTSSVTKQLIKK